MATAKTHDRDAIKAALLNLEQVLRQMELWGGEQNRPSEKALNSQSPFCLDTIEFHEWLEYVLIDKLTMMLESEATLPEKMLVHTYAQEKYRGQWTKYRELIGALHKLDALITIVED